MLMWNERLATLAPASTTRPIRSSIRGEGREARAAISATKEGRLAIEAFFRRFMPASCVAPPKVLQADGHSFSDVAAKVVSIINLASVAALEDVVGAPVDPLRFRGNVYVEGWPAWHEFDLVGQEIAIGDRAAQSRQADRALRRDQRRSRHRHPRSRHSGDPDADLSATRIAGSMRR